VTPSARYSTASAVRSTYDHWGVYGAGWYTEHPDAWHAAGWTSGSAWRACTWSTAAGFFGYDQSPPVNYDYGNSIVYQGDSVYVNGEAEASADGDWLPLGVFALTKPGQSHSAVSIQLAVNQEGVIRGNYTDTNTDKTQLLQGSVDKPTQRVALTVGDNAKNVIETGLYNLTQDEAPCLLHFGSERTEQWLLVRLQNPADAPK
jgi:hypothetical protein